MTFPNYDLQVFDCCFLHQNAALEVSLSFIEFSFRLSDYLVMQKSLCFSDLELHVREHVLDPKVHLSGSHFEFLNVPPCRLV